MNYNDDLQNDLEPFDGTKKPINNHEDNIGSQYYNSAIPYKIYSLHPDARLATRKDGMNELISNTVFATLILLVCGIFFAINFYKYKENEKILTSGNIVTGVINNSWTSTRGVGNRSREVRYTTYTYTYNGIEYTDTKEMSSGLADSLRGADGKLKGQSITVYVNPDDPSDTRIEEYGKIVLYLWSGGIVIAIIGYLMGIKDYLLAVSGHAVVYNDEKKGRKVWKII